MFSVYALWFTLEPRHDDARKRSEAMPGPVELGRVASGHASRMTDDGLAAFYRRYNVCCNEHRVEDLAQFVARDVVIDGTVRGLDAYAEELRMVIRAFPDYHWKLRRLLVDPPWIAAHLTDTGTHCGPFFGVPATARTVTIPEFAFYRIDADRIAEVWGSAFGVHLLQQIREPG